MEEIKFLKWDSDFFGYKVGDVNDVNVDIVQLLIEAKKLNYKLLYVRVHPENIVLNLECVKNSGILVDSKTTYLQKTPLQVDISNNKSIIYDEKVITDELMNLSFQSGIYSRYNIDKNFKNNEYKNLYSTWLTKSINKEIADKVIVYKEKDNIIGFLTLALKNGCSDLGLIAVNQDHRGKGVGVMLINKFIDESLKLKSEKLQVITQKSNINACSFYEKMGFKIEKVENIYHFWL